MNMTIIPAGGSPIDIGEPTAFEVKAKFNEEQFLAPSFPLIENSDISVQVSVEANIPTELIEFSRFEIVANWRDYKAKTTTEKLFFHLYDWWVGGLSWMKGVGDVTFLSNGFVMKADSMQFGATSGVRFRIKQLWSGLWGRSLAHDVSMFHRYR